MFNYNRIKELREEREITQSEIADALYMHTTQYGRYERGEREIPLNIAISIAKYFDVSLDYIAGLSDEKRPVPANDLTYLEKRLVYDFRLLDDFQKGQIFERIKSLCEK